MVYNDAQSTKSKMNTSYIPVRRTRQCLTPVTLSNRETLREIKTEKFRRSDSIRNATMRSARGISIVSPSEFVIGSCVQKVRLG